MSVSSAISGPKLVEDRTLIPEYTLDFLANQQEVQRAEEVFVVMAARSEVQDTWS